MKRKQVSCGDVHVSVSNVGGIAETEVTLEPGVTILTGRNATNRTSFLRATMAALGSDNVTLKGDADEGAVHLKFNGETYTRKLSRRGRTISFNGEPYLEDPERADLFAFLLESNDARRAVRMSGDLGEIIMRPVDTEEIQAEIEDAKRRRREIDDRIRELEELERQLLEFEERQKQIEQEIKEKSAEFEEIQEEIDEIDVSVEATCAAKDAFERKLDELNEARNNLQRVESRLEDRTQDLEEMETERQRLLDELDTIQSVPDRQLSELDQRLSTLQDEKADLDATINELQSIIRFNQNTLQDTDSDVFTALAARDEDGDVTDRLVKDTVTCWTCGTRVEESRIEASLDMLRELRNRKMDRRSTLDDEISDLRREKAELEERRRQNKQLQEQIDHIESEIEGREETIKSLHDQREEARERVAELETEVESIELEGREEVLELHTRANRLEFEIKELEGELDEINSGIARAEEELAEIEDLEDRRERVCEEIDDLRTRVDSIFESAVEEFNTHMETVLDVLEYENLDRIWLERRYRDGDNTPTCDLHVVRTSTEGTSYEDTIDHLSESEREVVGLVFGLAGYLAHAVYEEVPFMILDSLEAIDASRLSALIEYLEQFPTYLLVALLPDDADELNEDYTRVREI